MLGELYSLIRDTASTLGVEPPESLDDCAPVLGEEALESGAAGYYLVGLIGGKNVGKSSLVNALAGREISAGTSHGEGTQRVVAYLHATREAPVRQLLEREVPGSYELVTHRIETLSSQVLLDLPDFDSHYARHVEITRRMLRHMLYPVWIQSVEKYADQQARELLGRVIAGNSPENFLFCLNKVDQLAAREGEAAVEELREDYARRIARTLRSPSAPRVFAISATQPERWDLPRLRETLGRQKGEQQVRTSRELAVRQRARWLFAWFDECNLAETAARLARLEERAREEIQNRVVVPVLEHVVPAVLDDQELRVTLAREIVQRRVRRWPIVGAVHVLLDPLLSALRGRGVAALLPAPAESVVRAHLSSRGQSPARSIQAAFAQLQQSSPEVSRLYCEHRLWEPMHADAAAEELTCNLASAVEHQRASAITRLGRGGGLLGWSVRLTLTVGAALWFPIGQPVLEAYLRDGGITSIAALLVHVLGVEYLLKSVGFLAIYFVLLWLTLQWRSRRQVDRWMDRWKQADPLDPDESLAAQVVEWSERLLDPIRRRREAIDGLIARATRLRSGGAQKLLEPMSPSEPVAVG